MTEKKDIFTVATENPQELLDTHRGMYLMINAIAKQADNIEQYHRALLIDTTDVVKLATKDIVDGKVHIFQADSIPVYETPGLGFALPDVE